MLRIRLLLLLLAVGCRSSSQDEPGAAGPGPGASSVPGGVSTVEVTATGTGATRDEALRDALLRAVESVHGRAISMTSVRQELGGSEKTVAKSLIGASASKTESERTTVGGRRLEESTGGMVTSIRVLEEDEGRGAWTVKVLAAVAKFTPPGAGKPTVIVVIPRGDAATGDAPMVLHDRIADAITQGGKVALLDRSNDAEVVAELEFAGSDEVAATETLKRGQAQVADFVVLLRIDALDVDRTSRMLRMSGREVVSHAGRAEASFRIVHVATRQVLATGRATATRNSDEALRDAVDPDAWKRDMMAEVAADLARQAAAALFTAGGGKEATSPPAAVSPPSIQHD